jgi:hypothetical protein
MDEYIKRKKAIACVCSACDVVPDGEKGNCPYKFAGCKEYYNLFITPSADVRPVVRGHWIEDGSGCVCCSACGEEHEWDTFRANFCDNCGADMREVEHETSD